jgi:hypothetical protein
VLKRELIRGKPDLARDWGRDYRCRSSDAVGKANRDFIPLSKMQTKRTMLQNSSDFSAKAGLG